MVTKVLKDSFTPFFKNFIHAYKCQEQASFHDPASSEAERSVSQKASQYFSENAFPSSVNLFSKSPL